MYHSISPSRMPDPHRVRVQPRRLEEHLRLILRLGLRGVSLGGLLDAREVGTASRLIGLTFDDGYADFAQYAAPLLARYGMTASVYVVPGLLGDENRWDDGPRLRLMDANQVRAIAVAGHEVGSHSLTHMRLSGADPENLTAEVAESRRVLQEVLQRPVRGFCYPYGSFDRAALDAVRAAGYEYGCVTGVYRPGGRFVLPRCYVSPADRVPHLLARAVRHHLRQWSSGRYHGAPAERPLGS
jgi:peptidoglycan/xylan/chitin deacetylase (PgdA/CDA1 family)